MRCSREEAMYVVNVVERKSGKVVDTIGKDGMTMQKALRVERGVNINISSDFRTQIAKKG
jgi:hypothetical protein